jgi:ATP-dependent DNA helicase PIF1
MTTIEAPEALTEQFLHLSLLEEILPDETTLSDDQSVAISNILDGKNCYVYGPGGTGKTVLLKTAVQRLREEQKKNVAVCATTGIASESIDGVTIHSLAGCGVVENIHFLGLKGKANETRREVIQAYDVLFIDEISMLSGEMFDRLSEHFGIIRQNTTKPFGGLQVVVFGDFLQLQPIPKLGVNNSRLKAVCPAMMLDRGLCFQSFTWDMLEFTFCELKKVFRQEDEIFANLLSRVRRGEQRAGNEIVEYVESQRKIGSDDIRRFEMKLFSKNKDVNAFNTLKLNELKTEAQIYKAIDSEEPCVDISDNRYNDYCKSLKGNWRHLKEIRAEEIVELKVDCEIMMLLNTSVPGTTASDGEPRRLANGSRGKIIKFDIPDEEAMKSHVEKLEKEKKDTNKRDIDLLNRQLDWVKRAAQEKKRIPYVLFKGFEEAIPILPMEFSFDTSGLGKNVRLQIPIKLAFAITVHKSQGMSLDSCSVDASNVFAPAQVYVALSRCRSAAGLQIENLNSSKIKAPQDALDFYDHLRDPNKYPPNTYKWWQYSPMMNEKEKAANKILRQYYEPIKDKNENGCFSEFLSVKHNRMGKRAGDELLKEEPDANWKCKACNNKRQYSLECCFLVREQVARDFDTDVFREPWSQRRNSSVHTPQTTEPPSSLPRPDCDDEDTRIATRTTTRSRSEADDEDDGDLEHIIKRQRMRQELETINLQIELMERRNRLAQLQENET